MNIISNEIDQTEEVGFDLMAALIKINSEALGREVVIQQMGITDNVDEGLTHNFKLTLEYLGSSES